MELQLIARTHGLCFDTLAFLCPGSCLRHPRPQRTDTASFACPWRPAGHSAKGPHQLHSFRFFHRRAASWSPPFFNFSFDHFPFNYFISFILFISFHLQKFSQDHFIQSNNPFQKPTFKFFFNFFFIFHFSFFIFHSSFFTFHSSTRGPLAWLALLVGTLFSPDLWFISWSCLCAAFRLRNTSSLRPRLSRTCFPSSLPTS